MRQGQFGILALEPEVFPLQLLQATQLRGVNATVPSLPVVQSRLGHTILAGQLRNLDAGLRLLKHCNDLLFTESGVLHQSSPVGKLYSSVVLKVRGLQIKLTTAARVHK